MTDTSGTDRYRLMVRELLGAPPPPFPNIAGRVHELRDDDGTPQPGTCESPEAPAWLSNLIRGSAQ